MKTILSLILVIIGAVSAYAKPHCQSFNNTDNKVTIVFSDEEAGDKYSVSDVKLIPRWQGNFLKDLTSTIHVTFGKPIVFKDKYIFFESVQLKSMVLSQFPKIILWDYNLRMLRIS